MARKKDKAHIYCFIYTNILYHFQMFDQVDWPKILYAKTVSLVLAPIVLREIEKHKDDTNERRRQWARSVLSKLKALLEGDTPIDQLPHVRHNVTLLALLVEPLIDWQGEQLDQAMPDDRILASMLDFSRGHPSDTVLLLTNDFPLRLKARYHNINVVVAEGLVPALESPSPDQALKQALLKKVEALVPGVDISVYQDIFGAPIYRDPGTDMKTTSYTFVTRFFYLYAVTNVHSAVQYFAVTTRDKAFTPRFQSPSYPLNQTDFHITLGVSTFTDIPGQLEYIAGCLGAHDFSYYETRYLGNAGHYEDFGFGVNIAGYWAKVDASVFSVFRDTSKYCPRAPYYTSEYTEQDLVALDDFRANVVINTYAVSAPNVRIADYIGSNLGVNYYQVRTY